jgi:cytochrome c5
MRPRYIFATIGFASVFVVILIMLAAGFIPPDAVSKMISKSAVMSRTPEPVEIQVDAGAFHSSTPTASLASSLAPEQDGPSLLESHCAQCHTTQRLGHIKKSQTEWETTLAQMEAIGVHLTENEKVVLLNYLSTAGKP